MPESATSGTITVSTARMRKDATTNSDIVTTLKKGYTVTVISEKNGWLKCHYESYTGYIRGDLLSVDAAFTVQYAGRATTATPTKLLNKPTSYGSTLYTLASNQQVWLYGRIGSYYFVRLSNYKIGYIKVTDLKDVVIWKYDN